jgi:hypothetical protein
LLVAALCAACTATQSGVKPDSSSSDDAEESAEKLAKKEHELACALLDLDIARATVENDARTCGNDVKQAEQDLKTARAELDHFTKVEKDTALRKAQLDVEKSDWSMEQKRQELHELETMYQQEEVATLTKELVLQRGKVALQQAEKDLALERDELADLREWDNPHKQEELSQKVEKNVRALEDARAKLARTTLESRLKVLKAEQAIAELQAEIAKLKKSGDSAPSDSRKSAEP